MVSPTLLTPKCVVAVPLYRSVYILTELITGGELHGAIREIWLHSRVQPLFCHQVYNFKQRSTDQPGLVLLASV